MAFFYWNKNFEVGVESIDSQHRQLVDLINSLATAITEQAPLPDVKLIFSNLMEYAATHFSEEETLMATSQLSAEEKAQHLKAHRSFVVKAQEINLRDDLLQAEVAEQVLEFLTTWLISHILGSDMKMVATLNSLDAPPLAQKNLFDISPVERTLLGALTEAERRFRLISDHTPVLMWVSDATGQRGFFNKSWRDFIGAEIDTNSAEHWLDHIHPDDQAPYRKKLDAQLSQPQATETEYRLRSDQGHYHWFLEKILPRIDNSGNFLGLVASATDISSIKQAELLLNHAKETLEAEVAQRTAQLEQLMLTDPLTGVGNRRLIIKALTEEAVRAQRYQRPFSLIYFDLDHFKQVNDVHGHATGDAVLVGAAQSLKASLRDCDLLGRIGGEEFVVLLPETCIEDALQVAERMRSDVAEMEIPEVNRPVTVSAGVAEWRPEESGEGLLQRADRALYRAKESGRNCSRIDIGAANS